MKRDRRWLWIGGGLAGAALALALGVPLGTLLIVAALLACPTMMLRGMRGTHQGAGTQGHGGMACHPGSQETIRREDAPRQSAVETVDSAEPARRS